MQEVKTGVMWEPPLVFVNTLFAALWISWRRAREELIMPEKRKIQ